MPDKKQIFAVVDLETTGTKRGIDQIIQFGCALIQNRKIVNTISQNINPQKEIPRSITDLTGINNKQLKNAPTFAEIGPALHNLLEGTIFVAHNVNFDFPFLNQAFETIDLPALDIPAIDTVELAQILLPTAVSYKLQDLTALLSIVHKNPHHADSDAYVTACLFLTLLKRLEALPKPTMQMLAELGEGLTRQTGEIIKKAAENNKNQILPDYLHLNHGLVLRNKHQLKPQPIHQLAKYPKSPAAKKKIFGKLLNYRSSQAKMMNLIYDKLTANTDHKPLLIEAQTGSGKTLGYLLPSYFVADADHKIVVSTATTVLQNQLLTQTIPLAEHLLRAKLPVALVKSSRHYLDLESFYQTLQLPSLNKPTRILQMRLIVWLTTTKTGDVTELQLTNYNIAYLQRVTNHQHKHRSIFGDDEFVLFTQKLIQQASIVLTNHNYLLEHQPDLAGSTSLIIDEAEVFNKDLRQSHNKSSNFPQILDNLQQLKHHQEALTEATTDIYPAFAKINRGFQQIETLETIIHDLQNVFFESYIHDNIPKSRRMETVDEIIDIRNLNMTTFVDPLLPQISDLLNKIQTNFLQGLNQLTNMNQQISRQTQNLMNITYNLTTQVQQDLENFKAFVTLLQTKDLNSGVLLHMTQYGSLQSLDLAICILDVGTTAQELFKQYHQVILTGATLTVNHHFNYFLDQLNLEKDNVSTLKLSSPFDLAAQTRFLIINDAPDIKVITPQYFADYISGVINEIAGQTTEQILVLFNSLDMVKQTYYSLRDSEIGHQREILAQSVTGSNEKIFKRFSLSKSAILLGSNSFMTGVDLPGNLLRVLILTRLPFDAPERPQIKMYYQWLISKGKKPFWAEALPQATLKLKQGFGRLIRNESDRGVMVVLDNRLETTNYGKQMLHSLPKQVQPLYLSLTEAITNIRNFLH